MSEHGLKVYEYNADSASCHAEAGDIMSRWAKQAVGNAGKFAGENPADGLRNALADCWQHSQASSLVHILQDHDDEEDYHAIDRKSVV